MALSASLFLGSAIASENLEVDPAEEIALQRRKAQDAYSLINETNPLSDQFSLESVKQKAIKTLNLSPETVEKLRSSPTLGRLDQYISSSIVTADVRKVVESPIRSLWLWVQISWFVIYLLLRAWRRAVAQGFIRRTFESAWVFSLFLAVSLFLIPGFLFGPPYTRVVAGAISVMIG